MSNSDVALIMFPKVVNGVLPSRTWSVNLKNHHAMPRKNCRGGDQASYASDLGSIACLALNFV